MASFDNLTREIDTRYCLGLKARPLIQETVRLVSQQPGGLPSLVQRFKAAGFAVEVASWLEGSEPIPLSGQEVEQALLGSDAISSIAAKIGISQSFTRTILGYAIPNVVASLAKGGAIATVFRALASELFAPAGRGLPSSLAEEMQDGAQRIRPSVPHDGRAAPVLAGLIIPAITLLMVLGSLLGYFIGAGGRGPARPSAIVAQDEPEAPRQAASMPSPAPLGVAIYASAPIMVAEATRFIPPPRFEDGSKSQAGAAQQAEHFPAIHFATNRATPVPGSWPLVENAARLIKQLPLGTVVEIGGYTDSVGSAPANMRLSQRRANAVREALIRAGVHSANLTAKGYGSSYPRALAGQTETVEGRSNALAGDRGRNDRRVELRIHPQESGALP